jgi:mono/diheme cytochrome c family protein
MKGAFAIVMCAASISWAQSVHKIDPNWQAPLKAEQRKNPLAGNAEAAAGGKKLFERNCSSCHGVDGHGLGNAADLRSAQVQVEPDGTLFWKITNGNLDRGMPSFSGLPGRERWQLVDYLRELGK